MKRGTLKNKLTKKQRQCRRGLNYLTLYLCCLPVVAEADTSLVTTLTSALTYLTGDVGKIVASLAIVGGGFACFGMGKLPKGYFVAILLGVGIIFGVSSIMTALGEGS